MEVEKSKSGDSAQSMSTVPQRFEAMALRYSNRLAVRMRNDVLSYSELNRRANRIASAILAKRGVGSEPVALVFNQNVDAVAALLGVLKAGKFYVVIDPSTPATRVSWIMDDAGVGLILTNQLNHNATEKFTRKRDLLILDDLSPNASTENPELCIDLESLLALRYTSGSTGTPKGVVKTHANVGHRLLNGRKMICPTSDDRFTLLHYIGYGAAEFHLYQSLLNGASLHLFDLKTDTVQDLAKALANEQISIYHSTPLVFRDLAQKLPDQSVFPKLRLLHISGAPITKFDYELYWRKFSGNTLLQVGMGSTEASGICWAIVDRTFSFPLTGSPVGYPVHGKKILMLDELGKEVPPGEIGEIAVKSPNLRPNYWKQPKANDARYLLDPDGGSERIYLTGDLGRMLPDGFVIHMGRKDLMVKIRGYRVDIGEIEGALLEHPMVKEAGVTVWEREPGEKYLVGYIVVVGGSVLNVSDIREFLEKKLPSYMIPSTFMFLESLPLTNGKIDRKALPTPDNKRPELSTEYLVARDKIEKRMIGIWEEILGVRPIGIDDSFFDLGGHSLLAARLFARLDDEFGRLLPLSVLVSSPTVRLVAERIQSSREIEQFSPLVPFSQNGTGPALFAVPGVYGNVVGLADLSRELGSDQAFYGLQSIGLDGSEAPLDTIEDMARRYVAEMRKVQPSGPYVLVGACFGAGVICEMAHQLLGAGEEIGFLGLLDPIGLVMSQSRADSGTESEKIPANNLFRSFVTARLKLYRDEARGLSRHKRVRFIAEKIISLGQKLGDQKAIRGVRREMHQLAVFNASKLAGGRYRPKPLTGRLKALEVFLSAHPRRASLESFEWSRLWEGKTVLHQVPGKDSGDMLSGENASVLGALLRERLRTALSGKSVAGANRHEQMSEIALPQRTI